MSDILSKISSYNIFNYLFPGAIFLIAADQMNLVSMPEIDIVTQLLVYYFTGLVISRVGSTIVEPALKTVRFVKFNDYSKYISACEKDDKIDLLVEQNNSYRTILSGSLILLVLIPAQNLSANITLSSEWRNAILAFFFALLFMFSFRKQSGYISKRVAHHT